MPITLKTPLCFPEPQAGMIWHMAWENGLDSAKKIATKTENPKAFTKLWIWLETFWKRKKKISCLKESSKYILTCMLIFCFKFFHVHDLSLHCQHHYLILPVSSTQALPSVWYIDHVMAGCGWQEHWRGKMCLGCACFSVNITWVLCFQWWGDTQQKVECV